MADLDSFRATFKGDIVTPADAAYPAAIARWALNAVRPAAVVAFVRDAEDVARALRYAQAAGLAIAIRSGGHSPSGASSVDGGLVVDLSRYMTAIRVDAGARKAYVQAGALWKDVVAETMKAGLVTVSGLLGHVRWFILA